MMNAPPPPPPPPRESETSVEDATPRTDHHGTSSSSVMRVMSRGVGSATHGPISISSDHNPIMTLQRSDSTDSHDSTRPAPSSPPRQGSSPLSLAAAATTTTTYSKKESFDSSSPSMMMMMSNVITQPSPPPFDEPSSFSPSTTTTTMRSDSGAPASLYRSSSKVTVATPSRRSKRTRTPSAKKKAAMDSQRRFRAGRKQPSVSDPLASSSGVTTTKPNDSNNKSSTPRFPSLTLPAMPLSATSTTRRTVSSSAIETTTSSSTVKTTSLKAPPITNVTTKPTASATTKPAPSTSSIRQPSPGFLKSYAPTTMQIAKTTVTTSAPATSLAKPTLTNETPERKIPSQPTASSKPVATFRKPPPINMAPSSPSMELLNADLLHTPPDGTVADAMKDVDLEWALSETPITYFAESPPAATPPPPKRNTRIRTPFAKAPVSSGDSDDDDDCDCDASTKNTITSDNHNNKTSVTAPPLAVAAPQKTDKKSALAIAQPSPSSIVVKENEQVKPSRTFPASAVESTPTVRAAPSTTSFAASTTQTAPTRDMSPAPSTSQPVSTTALQSSSKRLTSATPLKRKAPTDSTPKRRSTRRASLLSSTKIHRILVPSSSKPTPVIAVPTTTAAAFSPLCTQDNVTDMTTSLVEQDQPPLSTIDVKSNVASTNADSCARADGAMHDPPSSTPVAPQKLSTNAPVHAPTPEATIKATIEFAPDSSFSTKRKRSIRRASLSSPYRSTKYDEEDDNVSATETPMKSTIDLAPDSSQSTKRRRGTRRASLSALGNKESPTSSLESSPAGAVSSMVMDIDETPTKRRRNARRASISSLGNTPSSLELVGQQAKTESPVVLATNKIKTSVSVQPLPATEARNTNSKPTTCSKATTSKASFKLPPLPKPLLSAKRAARRKSLSAVGRKNTVESTDNAPTRSFLEAIPPAASNPKPEATSVAAQKPSLLETTVSSVAKSSTLEAPKLPPSKPSQLERHNLSVLIPVPPEAFKPAVTKPSPAEIPTAAASADLVITSTAEPSPLDIPKPPAVLDKPAVGPCAVPKQVLANQDLNADTKIEYTPTMPRRSSRRQSISGSSTLSCSGRKLTSSASRATRIPNSITKRRLLPSAEKNSTMSGLATLNEDQQLTDHNIEASMIKRCAVKMFGNNKIKSEACVSARIFACYALAHSNGSRSSTFGDNTVSMRVKPLMPLLASLVRVEMTSLEERDIVSSRIRKESRRVHFSGFDCSSTKPPVEAKVGSHEHQQDSISEMILVSQQIKTLIDHRDTDVENNGDSSLVVRALRSLLNFLTRMSKDTRMMRECAKSIWASYPPTRLTKALDMYKKDFESILQRVMSPSSLGPAEASNTTYLERRLAEFAGQSIRFHLRRLFNPPPLPYTTPKDNASEASLPPTPKEISLRQSRVSDLVDLELPDTSRDSAVADGSISSLFSLALCRIYGYFGEETFVSALHSDDPIRLPDTFCTSPVSQRGLGTPEHPIRSMSSDELRDLIGDIDDVYNFLAAYHAIKFLLQVMRAPGVAREVKKMGGWSTIEKYAGIIQQQSSCAGCAEDAHFSAISYAGSMERFFAKIEDWLSHMEPKTALAEISIKQLAKRYKTKVTSPKQRRAVYKKFPHVKTIATVIDEGNARACAFPKVVSMV